MAVYTENVSEIPLWSKALIFSTTTSTRSISGVSFSLDGNRFVAHSYNNLKTDNTKVILIIETITGKIVSSRSY